MVDFNRRHQFSSPHRLCEGPQEDALGNPLIVIVGTLVIPRSVAARIAVTRNDVPLGLVPYRPLLQLS